MVQACRRADPVWQCAAEWNINIGGMRTIVRSIITAMGDA
jgi:hypothetical protein